MGDFVWDARTELEHMGHRASVVRASDSPSSAVGGRTVLNCDGHVDNLKAGDRKIWILPSEEWMSDVSGMISFFDRTSKVYPRCSKVYPRSPVRLYFDWVECSGSSRTQVPVRQTILLIVDLTPRAVRSSFVSLTAPSGAAAYSIPLEVKPTNFFSWLIWF